MSTPQAHGAQQGLAAGPLLGDVPRSRGEDLELLPEEADGRREPLGVVGEGQGNGTDGTAGRGDHGWGWPTRGGRCPCRPSRVGAFWVLHSVLLCAELCLTLRYFTIPIPICFILIWHAHSSFIRIVPQFRTRHALYTPYYVASMYA